MAGTPEEKVRLLGMVEVKPSSIALGGFFLTMGGIWAASEPCIAFPAIAVGVGLMRYGLCRMEKQDQEGIPLG